MSQNQPGNVQKRYGREEPRPVGLWQPAVVDPDRTPDPEDEPEQPPHPADLVVIDASEQSRQVLPPVNGKWVFDPMGGTIPAEEPVFILRGSDASTPAVLRLWLELNRSASPHWIAAVQTLIRRCEAWSGRRQAGWKVDPKVDLEG